MQKECYLKSFEVVHFRSTVHTNTTPTVITLVRVAKNTILQR